MILLIDNYDSFSYNLYQMIGKQVMGEIDSDICVIRNDCHSIDEIHALKPSKIIISPGPGRPEEAGNIIEVVRILGEFVPILGVCLGHQAICMAFGSRVTYAKTLMHGKQSSTRFDTNSPLFRGCKEVSNVARYHSLALDESTLNADLKITARTIDGEVMAIEHRVHKIYGVQFHPESILTEQGDIMLKNFIKGVK